MLGAALSLVLAASYVHAGPQASVNMTLVHQRPVEPQLFGLNSILGTIYAIPFDDPVLQDVVEVMRLGSWRYPGGTVANYYDITAGNYMPNCTKELCACCETKETISALLPPGALSGSNFMADGAVGTRLQASGPVWDLNVFTQSDANATKQIEYLKNAVPSSSVGFLELGNEFYISKNYDWRFPDAASYAKAVRPTIAAARAAFPDAAVAMVASQIHDASKKGGCGDNWNQQLRDNLPEGITDVTMHDYSIGNSSVQRVEGEWQKVAYTLAYSSVVLAKAAEGARKCFGKDVRIWQTEYNYAAGNGEGFGHNHGPLFPGKTNGTIHGAYLVSRMLAAVNDPTYRTMNIMCALAVSGVGWGGHSGIVGLDVDFEAKPAPRVRSAVVTGMAQVYAHLAYLAAPSEGTVSMAGLQQADGTGPRLNLTILGDSGIPCLEGAVFMSAAAPGGPGRVSPVLINRCPEAVVAMVGAPLGGAASAEYEGHVTTYDTSDEGGSSPLPSKDAPFPWPGPLRKTTSTRVQGLLPFAIEVPALGVVMASLSRSS